MNYEKKIELYSARLTETMKERGFKTNNAMTREMERDGYFVSPSTIGEYLNKRSLPGLFIAAQLAEFLDVSLDWMIGLNE